MRIVYNVVPRWRPFETNFGEKLRIAGYTEQYSFLKGRQVPYGTWGSVRPENFKPGRWGVSRPESVDVRSGDITTSVRRYRLARLAVEQAQQRARHLPRRTVQKIVIDARGQPVSLPRLAELINMIASKSKGLIPVSEISVLR